MTDSVQNNSQAYCKTPLSEPSIFNVPKDVSAEQLPLDLISNFLFIVTTHGMYKCAHPSDLIVYFDFPKVLIANWFIKGQLSAERYYNYIIQSDCCSYLFVVDSLTYNILMFQFRHAHQ